MDITLIVTGVIAALIIATLAKSVRIVPQAELQVVERLGRYNRVLSGGLNFIVPFVDTIRERFTTQEQLVNLHPQSVITKDNVSITIDGLVYLRVSDAKQATYEIDNLQTAIAQLAQTTLRAEIGKMELDETLSSREEMNQSLQRALDEASGGWGAKVTRVEISDISVPADVQEAMEMQLRASRERRAIETKAEADKNATIAKAQGDRQRVFLEAEAIERMAEAKKKEDILLAEAARQREILNAEGQKEALQLIAAALKENPQSGEFILAKDRIEAWNGIASSDSQNKVVVPYEATELLGSLSLMKDMMGRANKAH
ncbi:MAG: SPFH domain-containing protein [Pseudomonadota bacterium]|nr:SPFH domain-containing protein [Pseudomonadota bacterium]